MSSNDALFQTDTEYAHYEVTDTIYGGRRARVLYSGNHQAAQSGLAKDGEYDLLFDYNQRLIELIRGVMPQRILIIGGGAFTLPKAILEELPDVKLDVVELDGALLGIAQRYFDFQPSPTTTIHTGDGREFINNCTDQYDMVIIDAFMHTSVPPSLQTAEAAAALQRITSPKGIVAMNIIATYYGNRAVVLQRQVAAMQSLFKTIDIFPASSSQSLWVSQNFILTAHNHRHDLDQYVRYQSLAVPNVGDGDRLHDDAL
jgi:spermidine synthase